ncbi:MAG: DUF72 domain-containing protein [Deltaproteobacteria bacterium]|nr:DUF72 domain-containing protein [Deltaproteobacteria bacterium]
MASSRDSSQSHGEHGANPDEFLFRGIHPLVRMGTASDRYAGWLGQIYSRERFGKRITSRQKTVGGKGFKEQTLPVESVEEYFRHFSVLELDFTFYALLLDERLEPTRTFRVLQSYRRHLSAGDRLILKVPQVIFARKLWRGGAFVENPDYLNPELFTRRFLEPVSQLLEDSLTACIFEQEYLNKKERGSPSAFAADVGAFLERIPPDPRYHMEVRTEGLLREPYFEVLERFGVGQVFSHWSWLPSLKGQFQKGGQRFLNRGGQCVVRLMTPKGMRYEEAYSQAHPFDREIDGMMSPGMVEETAGLMLAAADKGVTANVIINNRAGGNAPVIAQKVSRRFSERLSAKRGGL